MTAKGKPRAGVPLVVDFDGTLQFSDVNAEGMAWLLRHRPWACVVLAWLLLTQGRAAAKLQLQEWAAKEKWVPPVPLDGRVLALMGEARQAGREVLVVTGSTEKLVAAILVGQGVDYPVNGTTEAHFNLTRHNKAARLVGQFGERGFDYAGNSRDDLAVWARARKAIVVNAPRAVAAAAKKLGNVEQVLPVRMGQGRALWKALRPHQWLKNLLVFVPLVTAHMWGSVAAWSGSVLAFMAFCFCASGIYLINDLLDVNEDRLHATKRLRPFAAGTLSIPTGLMVAPLLLAAGLVLGWLGGPWLLAVMVAYVLLTNGYSWCFKHWALGDVVVLAALYGVRMLGGAAATGIPLSYWLAMFAFLVFYSLALLKRYVELCEMKASGKRERARGYHVDDRMVVAVQGMGAGLLSVMVVGLYIDSPAVGVLYKNPDLLGLLCPLGLWALGRMWLLAHRGQMHDDPVVFAARDPVTWGLGLLALAVMVLGAA